MNDPQSKRGWLLHSSDAGKLITERIKRDGLSQNDIPSVVEQLKTEGRLKSIQFGNFLYVQLATESA